jgi:lipoprotein NlpD
VRASASGTVVYSGSGLIGYGELIIIKHNDRMLSAYAHNRVRNVAEGERVAAGQQIGTLGRNERDEPVLHFEIRRDGQPVNPISYLPQR